MEWISNKKARIIFETTLKQLKKFDKMKQKKNTRSSYLKIKFKEVKLIFLPLNMDQSILENFKAIY